MAVGDCLPSCFAVVDPNIEPADSGVSGFDIRSPGLEQCGAGLHFGLPEFEIAPDVPLRDNESMEVGHGKMPSDRLVLLIRKADLEVIGKWGYTRPN